jgi:AcrR family transcriptional regulator
MRQDVNSTPQRLRQRHAELTRRAILDTARRLFTEDGYATTPIRKLAEQAGVAVPTIYATFGSKPGVLMGLLDLMDTELVEPIAQRLMQADDPGDMLDLMSALERQGREAGADVLRLVMQAAASEPEVARVLEEGFDRHRDGVARVCERLDKGGHLRRGLTLQDATATALALTSMEVYDEVVRHQGWSHDQYQNWLARTLRHALLDKRPI